MKKSIIVPIDQDKLNALRMYLAQKDQRIEDELEKYADELYKKIVPQNVRDYISMTAQSSEQNKSKRPAPASSRSASVKPSSAPAAEKPSDKNDSAP